MSNRIQKVLANNGFGSRRTIEQWIKENKIKVNKKTAKLGDCISEQDVVLFNNKKIHLNFETETKVILYHKPVGEVCTKKDEQGRPTVFKNLPSIKGQTWINIGRLDINTSGLLLFTNDGELANKYMHPKYRMEREYLVRASGVLSPKDLNLLKNGVKLEDGMAKFDKIEYQRGSGVNHWYNVILTEGRNRIVRRLFSSTGLSVSRLIRIRFNKVTLPRDLPPGKFKGICI